MIHMFSFFFSSWFMAAADDHGTDAGQPAWLPSFHPANVSAWHQHSVIRVVSGTNTV